MKLEEVMEPLEEVALEEIVKPTHNSSREHYGKMLTKMYDCVMQYGKHYDTCMKKAEKKRWKLRKFEKKNKVKHSNAYAVGVEELLRILGPAVADHKDRLRKSGNDSTPALTDFTYEKILPFFKDTVFKEIGVQETEYAVFSEAYDAVVKTEGQRRELQYHKQGEVGGIIGLISGAISGVAIGIATSSFFVGLGATAAGIFGLPLGGIVLSEYMARRKSKKLYKSAFESLKHKYIDKLEGEQ